MNEGNPCIDYQTIAQNTIAQNTIAQNTIAQNTIAQNRLSSIYKKLKTNHLIQMHTILQLMMLTRILTRIFADTPKTPLGRWATCTTAQQSSLKINYANEDHCGSCGEYMIQKQKQKESEEDYVYYMIESVPDQLSNRKIK